MQTTEGAMEYVADFDYVEKGVRVLRKWANMGDDIGRAIPIPMWHGRKNEVDVQELITLIIANHCCTDEMNFEDYKSQGDHYDWQEYWTHYQGRHKFGKRYEGSNKEGKHRQRYGFRIRYDNPEFQRLKDAGENFNGTGNVVYWKGKKIDIYLYSNVAEVIARIYYVGLVDKYWNISLGK